MARDCKLWEAAQFLLNFLVANFSPEVPNPFLPAPGEPGPLPPVRPAKTFNNFLYWIEKVEQGDASWILPDHEFGDWVSLEDAWDGAATGFGALGPSSPESLLSGIQSCRAPSQEGVYQDAVHYIRLLQELKPLADQMHKTINQLEHLDRDLYEKWKAYRDACRAYQLCIGGDPSKCDVPQIKK